MSPYFIYAPAGPDGGEGLLAILIRYRPLDENEIVFPTPKDCQLQAGFMRRPAGYQIRPHVHKPVDVRLRETPEVLHVRSGAVVVTVYTSQRERVEEATLFPGDTIVLLAGGHGFEFLADTEIFEVRQGPYCDNKERFDAVV